MPLHIDIASLMELYPAAEERRAFLRQAHEILRRDRSSLQDALACQADTAGDLAHRIQGTLAFLSGDPDGAAAAVAPITDAARRHGGAGTRAAPTEAIACIIAVETELASLVQDARQ